MRQREAQKGKCEENLLANPQVGLIPHRDLRLNSSKPTAEPICRDDYPAFRPRIPTQETACGLKVGILTEREGVGLYLLDPTFPTFLERTVGAYRN